MATKNENPQYPQDNARAYNGPTSEAMRSQQGQSAWARGSQGYAGTQPVRPERDTGRGTYYRAAMTRISRAGEPTYGRGEGYGEGERYGETGYGTSGTTGEMYGREGYGFGRREGQSWEGQGYGREGWGRDEERSGYGPMGTYTAVPERGREGWGREGREGREGWGREQWQGREQRGVTGWYDRAQQERVMGRRGWQKEPLAARDVMTRNVRAVTPQTTLKEAAQIMKDENCGIVPVVDESLRLLGVLTDRDMVIRAFREDKVPSQVRVQDIMSDEVEAVTEDERITDVIHLMGKKQIRRVPVVASDDRLLGIISMSDVANRADYDEELQRALERISSRRSFWTRFFT